MNYNKYRCGILDYAACMVVAAAISALLAWLFYRSFFGLVLLPVVYGNVLLFYKGYRAAKQKDRLLCGFREGMLAVTAALLAGYSLENAWKEAERDLTELFGEQHPIVKEFAEMNSRVHINQPLEETLTEFSLRSGNENIESFAEIFSFAKRGGGDFAAIIQTTVHRLNAKLEVEREIQTVIAGKKFESRIMNLMPLFLLIYMNFSSAEFMAPLYGNLIGVTVMTAALLVYGAAIWWSGRIMDIKL